MALSTNVDKDKLEITGKKVKIGPDRLTRFERARIVGARALQLSMGAPILLMMEDIQSCMLMALYKTLMTLVVTISFNMLAAIL